MDWYIQAVEKAIAQAEQNGVTHVALDNAGDLTLPVLIKPDMVVINKDLKQLYPYSTPRPASPAPPV